MAEAERHRLGRPFRKLRFARQDGTRRVEHATTSSRPEEAPCNPSPSATAPAAA
jgi:hypothetical protein